MPITIGGELERRRLERRALRLQLVIAVQRERTAASGCPDAIRPGLERALADFTRELARVHGQLARGN